MLHSERHLMQLHFSSACVEDAGHFDLTERLLTATMSLLNAT